MHEIVSHPHAPALAPLPSLMDTWNPPYLASWEPSVSGHAQGPQAMEVMRQAVEWSRSADPSFVRHFVFQALALAAPPYHPAFAAVLIRYRPRLGLALPGLK